VVPYPGCGRSVTDFCGWDAHRSQLRCPDDVSDGIYERRGPGGALNLNSTRYPDHGRYGDFLLQGKIPTAGPVIEPETSWLVVRRSDHQATRLVSLRRSVNIFSWGTEKIFTGARTRSRRPCLRENHVGLCQELER
jgi:hypothetical protein